MLSILAQRTKGIRSLVAGKADISITPNIEAGNMLAKELTFIAKAEAAGIVLGAKAPIMLTSRADNDRARLASSALVVLYDYWRSTGQAADRDIIQGFCMSLSESLDTDIQRRVVIDKICFVCASCRRCQIFWRAVRLMVWDQRQGFTLNLAIALKSRVSCQQQTILTRHIQSLPGYEKLFRKPPLRQLADRIVHGGTHYSEPNAHR
jgi:hypothetical protein